MAYEIKTGRTKKLSLSGWKLLLRVWSASMPLRLSRP